MPIAECRLPNGGHSTTPRAVTAAPQAAPRSSGLQFGNRQSAIGIARIRHSAIGIRHSVMDEFDSLPPLEPETPPNPKLPSEDRWYLQTWSILVAFSLLAVFAVPLVWMKRDLSVGQKVVITVIMALATCAFVFTYLAG
jgi:hypothetical protein